MKNLVFLPITLLYVIVLVSCTADAPSKAQVPVYSGGKPGEKNDDFTTGVYFGFLDGGSSSSTYLEMPIESSPTKLIVGRWNIKRLGIDENNDGNLRYFNYQDYEHKDCGLSFLQFNNDGVVFENSYYKSNGSCTLFSEINKWELIEENRFKIHVYDNIYLVNVTQTELVLKYDWSFENSLWAPMQVFYYYERTQEPV
jgi:hypothetical protein